jgi:hypothetical protein
MPSQGVALDQGGNVMIRRVGKARSSKKWRLLDYVSKFGARLFDKNINNTDPQLKVPVVCMTSILCKAYILDIVAILVAVCCAHSNLSQ